MNISEALRRKVEPVIFSESEGIILDENPRPAMVYWSFLSVVGNQKIVCLIPIRDEDSYKIMEEFTAEYLRHPDISGPTEVNRTINDKEVMCWLIVKSFPEHQNDGSLRKEADWWRKIISRTFGIEVAVRALSLQTIEDIIRGYTPT